MDTPIFSDLNLLDLTMRLTDRNCCWWLDWSRSVHLSQSLGSALFTIVPTALPDQTDINHDQL